MQHNIKLDLAKRMRSEDAEQFFTLVRMHLSFVLDLNSEDYDLHLDKKGKPMKWVLPFTKKPKGHFRNTEGCQLTDELMAQLNCLIEHLMKPENIVQEGIFRRTGNLRRQQDLKCRLASGEQVNLDDAAYSVHDCASLLKSYLSELPEPLLTESLYTAYCQVSQLNKERLSLALKLLILLIPEENYSLLQRVVDLLNIVSLNSDSNRMSTNNLATLFTPHLIWPRQIPAETLHANSQSLWKIVTFMIEETNELFNVPDTLATDIRAYFEKKERRRRSPMRQLNESVCDGTTANTVFTFVDRERTAQENGSNPTELALAQLYAHIQSLPDSARKRRLVKNFNKKNGQGTPAVRNDDRSKHRRSRSLRDSIKKHLPGFGKNGPVSPNSSSSPDVAKTPLILSNLSKLRETPRIKQSLPTQNLFSKENRDPSLGEESDIGHEKKQGVKRTAVSATADRPRKRISPGSDIPPSTVAYSSESLVLPTRKPTKRTTPPMVQASPPLTRGVPSPEISQSRISSSQGRGAMRTCPGMATQPTAPLARHRRQLPSFPMTTSTPAHRGAACAFITPYVERNTSMSPITRSAQRMSRAMQETMMTPRSRKPVVSLSGSDLCQLTSLEPWTGHNVENRLIVEESEGSHSLSSTFRDYLVSRSVLTASPVDLSFSSRTDDFQSLSSKGLSLEELQSLANEEMSASLLYCMEGNDPNTKSPAPHPRTICETAI